MPSALSEGPAGELRVERETDAVGEAAEVAGVCPRGGVRAARAGAAGAAATAVKALYAKEVKLYTHIHNQKKRRRGKCKKKSERPRD